MRKLFIPLFILVLNICNSSAQILNYDSIQTLNMDSIVVVGSGIIDIAKDRETPVALSSITKKEISEKTGNQEFPSIMKNTPSMFVSNESGGYGESRITVRGFGQSNVALLFNGQPVNGMGDGKLYWSNWSGLTDIANEIQIQRGLGSSKLAISSVGGTINIITKATEKRKSTTARFLVGNDGYVKTSLEYNSGLKGKWGISLLASGWRGDGYNRYTNGSGQTYFLSVGYKPSDKHLLNFMIYGSPQQSNQNFFSTIKDFQTYRKKYNVNEGWFNGSRISERSGYNHKPIANLNWDWKISNISNLSTVLYASWGRVGTTGSFGSNKNIDGYRNKETGLIQWESVIQYNQENAIEGIGISKNTNDRKASYILRTTVEDHQWYGLVSNFNHKLNKNLQFNIGVDVRHSKGSYYQSAHNFLGLNGIEDKSNNVNNGSSNIVTQSYNINPWSALFRNISKKDRIGYDYDQKIGYVGTFGQIEYTNKFLSTFIQAALSEQYNSRIDRFNYTSANQKSETLHHLGFNIKGGINYKLNHHHSMFGNAGYYSRQPFQDNLFLYRTNERNPLVQNEKIIGFEIGYQLHYPLIDFNANIYSTSWKDRSKINATPIANEMEDRSKIDELHQGLELDILLKPTRKFNIKGYLSLGKWEYHGDAYSTIYNTDDLSVKSETKILLDGVKTPNAPQFSYGFGIIYKPFVGFSIDADLNRYEKIYSNFDATKVDPNTKVEILKLPNYFILDMGISYALYFKDNTTLRFRLNVNNVINQEYLYSRTSYKEGDAAANNETYKGIDTANQVYFGNGRTWNCSVSYSF